MDQKMYPISEQTINSILGILGNLPYVQVAKVIDALQREVKHLDLVPTQSVVSEPPAAL